MAYQPSWGIWFVAILVEKQQLYWLVILFIILYELQQSTKDKINVHVSESS